MKIKLLSIMFLGLQSSIAQSPVTVSVNAGYQNQAWYSLKDGPQGTAQSKDNWDIGFEITGFSASIIANNQKANFVLYKAPFSALQWNSLDTIGINAWPKLYNSDTSWAVGAFNVTKNPSDDFDLGWGVYDLNTHYVTGDSLYVVKLAANSYKKLMIENLANGTYNFVYADIDGNNEQIASISKSEYVGKNFAYYNLTANQAVDREPASANWDLTFTRYITFLNTGTSIVPYPVVGILQNKGVTVAQANNVPDAATYTDYGSHTFKTAINEIGYDWKAIDLNTSQWLLVRDTCYFVKDKTNKIWKVSFSGFGGSTTGDFTFEQSELVTTGIFDNDGYQNASFTIYPNPSTGEYLNMMFGTEMDGMTLEVSIVDLNGTEHLNDHILINPGISKHSLDVSQLHSGIYSVKIKSGSRSFVQKFVKQ